MMKLILIFLSFFILSGCTINIGEEETKKEEEVIEEDEVDKEEEEKEDVVSVGKTSSLSSPLSVGDYGIASKYNAIVDKYKDVDVTITEVFSNPSELIDKYNKENPDTAIKSKDGFKYVVLEYEVIFHDFETESFGTDVILDMEVVNVDGASFVLNDIKQVITTYILSNDTGVVDGEKGKVKVAFLLPNNVSNYIVKFGTLEETIAYYKV